MDAGRTDARAVRPSAPAAPPARRPACRCRPPLRRNILDVVASGAPDTTTSRIEHDLGVRRASRGRVGRVV
ncbi:hypothetical protein FHG89_04285 [Micromonospora orduensis]|uniref:Uncharacterized protein n=1 Tax=Micromonospora orduensis TaxID=1420891 RepID=A0A5C4QYD4_9ACTN|nr:hypothetical protein FHG89_04285 [Micromonospora orduensis]